MGRIAKRQLTETFGVDTLCIRMSPQELKRARKAMGLSQRELGERLQTTRNSVARWERGEQKITHITALAIRYLLLMQKIKPKGKKEK